ncbi:MAG: hypothetical protein D6693_01680 [Planctomycetota bacterium]|nr:MAG: hypothetical protein D6693_01680 [Planctomycetota bacterium]
MRMDRLIPSMFHRRLALLGVFFLLGGGALLARVGRLTIADHEALLAEAQRRLVTERWVETTRGRILDRAGRVLAEDRPAFDLTVDYQTLTGERALILAARDARRAHAAEWPTLGPAQRDALIRAREPERLAELERLWADIAAASGVSRAELEDRRSAIIAGVQRMALSIWERRRLARQRELSRQRETLVETALADVARPIAEQRRPHPLLTGLDDRTAFALRKIVARHDGVELVDGVRRDYPYETVETVVDLASFPSPLSAPEVRSVTVRGAATGLIGWMRNRVFAEDAERRRLETGLAPADDPGRYLPGDSVGAAGLERALEASLRGTRGRESRRVDTGAVERVEPAPGADARLTIDIDLQARILAALDPSLGLTVVQDWHGNHTVPVGERLAAGVAVIDVDSAEPLALASTPGFTIADLRTVGSALFRDAVMAPTVNRAIHRPYEPGSIVKPLVLATAVSEGVHDLSTRITCDGHLLPGRDDIYRCWIYRPRFGMATHSAQVGGPLDAPEAIARSCNIYFYTLGRALGPARLAAMYDALGVGRPFTHGLEIVSPGFLGRLDGAPLEPTDAIFMGIGQGPVSWTPLHAALAYGALARGGVVIEPRLLMDSAAPASRNLGWDRDAVDAALEGLRRGVNEPYGTGNHFTIGSRREPIFNARGVRVAGKTGTAQAGPTYRDADGDGRPDRDDSGEPIVLRRGDHAWTVVLVGPEDGPYRYAIAVVVEHGGSGGRVAGPIANQVIYALRSTGYLPGGDS